MSTTSSVAKPDSWRRSPIATIYLEKLRDALGTWFRDRKEIEAMVSEIESHLAEARRGGEPVADAIKSLGSPEDLAEAYAVLSLDGGSPARTTWMSRVIGQATRASRIAASLLVLGVGGALTVVCALFGLAATLGAVVLPFVPPRLLEPTLRAGLPQLTVLLAGVLLLGLAAALSRWLTLHSRLVRRFAKPPAHTTASSDAGSPAGDSVARFPVRTTSVKEIES